MIEPPAAYVHPCDCELFTHEIFVGRVDSECRKLGAVEVNDIVVCSVRLGTGACIVILPKLGKGGVGRPTQDALRRHELAHCNGWRHEKR